MTESREGNARGATTPKRARINRFIFSELGDYILSLGKLVAGLACLAALVGGAREALTGNPGKGFFAAIFGVVLPLAMFVAFGRVQYVRGNEAGQGGAIEPPREPDAR